MTDIVEVTLWGTRVGHIGYASGQTALSSFEYAANFRQMGVEISPLKMPTSTALHAFADISQRTFKGLAGVFADSLPDKFGNQLIDLYFADKSIRPEDISTLDRILYIGDRGMGALEYHPAVALSGEHNYAGALDVAHLADLANRVTSNRASLRDRLERAVSREQALRFIRVGSSAGGARSKALVATAADGTLKDGTVDHGIDHQYWLLKFDGEHNSDRDSADPVGMPRVEYIYSIIARDCGIQIPSTAFIELDGSFHFLIERFDRITRNGKLNKLHYVSWSGIAHADRDTTGAFSYEQLALTIKQLNLGQTALTELFRRAVFNIVGRNQDDHTKNFGFLMDRQGHWSLAPAFDMTYSFDPTGLWTQVHQIRLAGKQDDFALDDLLAFAQLCNLKKRAAIDIVKRTASAFQRFDSLAKEYQVPNALRETIGRNLRLKL